MRRGNLYISMSTRPNVRSRFVSTSVCGGCKWQHLPYEEQLYYKQKQVYDNLTRIGKVEMEEKLPILGSERTTFYRNKLEFTFSNKKWLTEEEIQSVLLSIA